MQVAFRRPDQALTPPEKPSYEEPMDPTIRDATPDDAPFLAWVIQAAARSHVPLGVWDFAFPGPDGPRLEYLAALALAEPPSFAHYTGFLVAEREGRPIAALSGYDPAHADTDAFMAALGNALQAKGWSAEHRALALARMAPMVTCVPDSPPGTWIVEWVAALPEARGRGVARALLLAILERGRAANYTTAQISYLIGNDPASAAYERVGFATIDEKRDPAFEATFKSAGIARMQRAL